MLIVTREGGKGCATVHFVGMAVYGALDFSGPWKGVCRYGFVVSLVTIMRSCFWDGVGIGWWVVDWGWFCEFLDLSDEFWSGLLPASGSEYVSSGVWVLVGRRVKRRIGVGLGGV